MLKRKIEPVIREYLTKPSNKMLVVDGARQVGKSYIIRRIGKELFPNFIEINMENDRLNDRIFAETYTAESFYLALSTVAGEKMGERDKTLVFIDEIQAYNHLLTLIKFLKQDDRFTYIASGSLLGVALKKTTSIPVGSISIAHMYPLDLEEFAWANDMGDMAISHMRDCFEKRQSVPENIHNHMMQILRRYLLVGGMPDAINTYIAEKNIVNVRRVQQDIMDMYKIDAAKYETDALRKLQIQRIYSMIPSNMENRRKRIQINKIEDKKGKRTSDYQEEFEYLVASGVALEVDAISNPTYPLVQNAGKNLLKLYLNDVGLLSNVLFGNNILPVLEDRASINLGSVYETLAAQELKAHDFNLYYYDNKKNGEVDYLIDDSQDLCALPIEIKSGKDYTQHSALDKFLSNKDYNIHKAFVLSNERQVHTKDDITYMPIYNLMFIQKPVPLPINF